MNKFGHWPSRPEPATAFSRRGFLIGATGAGITFGFLSLGYADAQADQAATAGRFEPTIWYDIDEAGVVTVNIAEAEMGQHVGTALARIVADELEANWNDVRLRYVDSDPKWGLMVTGGSWSVWQNFIPLSRAGAAGRITLIQAGARQLGADASDCHARNGAVHAGTKSISYGELIRGGGLSRMWSADELEAIPLKSAEQRRLVGQAASALDVPAKTNGTAIYGIDAMIDGMLFARPLIPPTRYGSEVDAIDDKAAREIPGYLRCIALDDPSGTVPGWVVVLAETYAAAIQAADRTIVTWTSGKTSAVTEDDILQFGREQVSSQSGGAMVVNDAGVDEAFATASEVIEAFYTTSTVLHFQLEPVNALAYQADDGRWEIHTGNQWQSLILPVLSTALGVPEKNVIMRSYLIGGGFGRRLNGDYAVPAALAAKAAGRPVKLVWTREDDARFDSVRSPSVQRMRMAFNSNGEVASMQHHASAGWPTQVMAPGFMPPGLNGEVYDPFAIHGADNWYSLGPQRLRTLSNTLANDTFRPGWLRSVGAGWVNWALESFIDEAAHAQHTDPVEFRLAHLKAQGRNAGSAPFAVGGASRQANVLRMAAARAGYGQALPDDTGFGIATTFGQERTMPTWTACVARVRVDRKSGKVYCEKLTLVIDCGIVVHPDGALAQAEGAALWGLSMALHEGTHFADGQVHDRNLNSYTPLRMADVPELDIELIDSLEAPVGMGEPGTTVVGPAIGNAIFAAIGVRLRHLPIRQQDILSRL